MSRWPAIEPWKLAEQLDVDPEIFGEIIFLDEADVRFVSVAEAADLLDVDPEYIFAVADALIVFDDPHYSDD